MKRLLTILAVVAFLAALPLSHVVMAGPAEKVVVCHQNSANDTVFGILATGKMIEVSENAVPALLAQGDSVYFGPLTEEVRDALEEFFGYKLPNADCFYFQFPTP